MKLENLYSLEAENNFEDVKTPEELLEYMKEIKYGYVGKNNGKVYEYGDDDFDADFPDEYFLQRPEQLLESKHGVCWDQVELERDWFSKHDCDFKVFYLAFLKKTANNLPTHTFLTYKEGEKWCWFENSFGDHKGIHEYASLEELMEDVKKKHLRHAISEGTAVESDFNDLRFCEYEAPLAGVSPVGFVENILRNYEPLERIQE